DANTRDAIIAKIAGAKSTNSQALDMSNIATPFVSDFISPCKESLSAANLSSPQSTGATVVEKTPNIVSRSTTAIKPAATNNSAIADLDLARHNAAANSLQQNALNAHKAFLDARKAAQEHMSALIQAQANVRSIAPTASIPAVSPINTLAAAADVAAAVEQPSIASEHAKSAPFQTSTSVFDTDSDELTQAEKMSPGIVLTEKYNQPKQVIFDQADLVEFAEGDIAKVFGEAYAPIDQFDRRVRLPTTDYLLVSRVTDLEATTNIFKPCYMATEYDIPTDAAFLIDGQIPWSVSVESGQCDLMLISYLGIDFECKGERVYRLLDCELTFLEDMAFGGETLRYEIHIDSYARNGDQFLFFFHYDCFVGGKKVLIMRNGCAGFFTDEELDDGKGVILNDKDKAQLANAVRSSFTPLINNTRTQYDYQDMMKLVRGDIAGCFGPKYDQAGRNPSLKFSSKKFLMIERVTKIDPHGGHWGLGVVEGQKDLAPDHWYFPCHFKGDQVMAGSLMSEGCGQLAMFFMLWLGMHSHVNNARFQPVPGEAQTVRCRGQVAPQSNTLTYRMEVTDMGMQPYPFMKANIDIILDGKVVVDFKNLSVMIKEQDETSPYAADLPAGIQLVNSAQAQTALAHAELDENGKNAFANVNAPLMWVESDTSAALIKGVTPIKHIAAPEASDPARQNRVPDTLPFTAWHLFEFATGNISNCFGPEFDVYQDRIPPRTPCGDLQLVTQVIDVQGQRGELKKPSSCVAEYEVPHNAWYFSKNSHQHWMPYSVLMEISLQPNGFISGYMGTTLQYPDKDLFFRNLDGRGTLLKHIDLRGKTITNKSVMLSTSQAGGSIIQSFTFELLADGDTFYQGSAVFGYFSADALTNQLGIDNGRTTNPWFVDNDTAKHQIEVLNLADDKLSLYTAPAGKPHYKLAGGQLNFVDTVSIVEGGGNEGKGYIYGERTIDPTDWFFRYHFHQDPVMPGSLGVEAIIELLQSYALKNDLGAGFNNPRFIAPLSEVVWKYRGQITPLNKKMELDVHISDVIRSDGEVRIVGNANLSKDGLRIYHVSDIALSIVEA
ncbi:MAG: beta-hydroxydecanoyl-ACP dehydratase, partial [Pseudomonadales bacterium]|nr:beta-hydroxydecanoyl-ACP dehydratase [Pseudomonadales bacterium]